MHAVGRRRFVGAVGDEQQNPPVVEIVGEEHDEIEGCGIGPVQILEHEQHRCRRCALGEQAERLLEHLQLRARHPGIDPARIPERTHGLDDRLIRQLRADEIDRATEQDVESRVAGTPRELGREPGLADAGFSSDEHGRTTPGSRRIERTLQFPELVEPSDEHLAPARHHPTSIAQPS